MRIAYFDCFSGASGDMILGALLDAGLTINELNAELDKLPLSNFKLEAQQVVKQGIAGTLALVGIDQTYHEQHQRKLDDLLEMLDRSDLTESVREKSKKVFKRIAWAEARIHRVPVESVHFHEVGAADAIIDVVGSVVGLDILGMEGLYCSPVEVGSGMVHCSHGFLPVPAPATAELIKGVPIYSCSVAAELLTPTGAAILSTLAEGFGPLPLMKVERIGYGAGTADLPGPNMLRVLIGTPAAGNRINRSEESSSSSEIHK